MNSKNSTEIYCDDHSQYLITNVQNVRVSGIEFVHCSLQIESVMSFILEESSFSRAQYHIHDPDYYYDVLHIKSSSATIKGCNFSNNNRLPLHIENSSTELHYTTFVNNEGGSTSDYRHRGGALLVENIQSIINIHHCSFIDNNVQFNGGVIFANSSLSIQQSHFLNNRVTYNRQYNGYGGAMYMAGINISLFINQSEFVNNRIIDRAGSGGVAYIRSATVSILNSTFSQNRATENGGVFAVDDSEMAIHGSIFDNNTAGANGGVIGIKYLHSAIFISHTSFTNNQATEQGGVIYLGRKGSQVKIGRSDVSSNNATRGGFATVLGSSLQITASNILNNTAEIGEVIRACSSDISVSDQLIIDTDPAYSVCTFTVEMLMKLILK